jgi:biotin synthase
MSVIRNNWTREEIEKIYNTPVLDLIYNAGTVHRQYHEANEVQVCTLLSVKTGGCPEDCAYCPQAARYHTDVKVHKLMEVGEVMEKAIEAKEAGSTRFCMGAAWREVRDNKDFDKVLDMVKGVSQMGMEVCCTLGMLSPEQAQKLKDAGLYAYNHNLDTSEEFYQDIITTRNYGDRLDTLENVRKAKISVCSGGIIGMGEKEEDRIGMLHTLATLPEHPESVPVNALVPVEGTPLEDQEKVSVWEMIRMIATARIIMPKAMVRLSAGRVRMSVEEQALCFMAGANSIFAGDKLLTTPNPAYVDDKQMFQILQLKPRPSHKENLVKQVVL